jgi:putative addiction module component (TIGR02574 family)
MADTIQLEQLLRLPQAERARLAKALLESLHDEPELPEDDVDTAWIGELERRAADARANPHDLVDASDLHDRLEAELRQR